MLSQLARARIASDPALRELATPPPSPYHDDPARFIDDAVVIDAAQDDGDLGTMPFTLWPAQADLLAQMRSQRLLLVLKARQLGISWLMLAYALWLCLFRAGRVVLIFSKSQDEANELARRVRVMYDRLPDGLRASLPALTKGNTEEIGWANGSRILAMPATKSAGRTYTASLIIADEFAFMMWATELYTSVKPTIDGGGQMLICSTANGEGNLFHELCQRALAGLGRFAFAFLPWHARPERDQAWYQETAADAVLASLMGQEYPATPEEAFAATNVDAFLPAIELWDACRDDSLPPLGRHEPCILAMDAGESNDCFAVGLISRHPTQLEVLAVRYARVYVPAPGQALDFDAIEEDIRLLIAAHAVQQGAYDPMLLGQMVRRLTTGARPVSVSFEPFPQGSDRLEADKGLFDVITQRKFAFNGSAPWAEVLRQHIKNANKKVDPQSRQLRIVKRTYALKIDAAVMLSMGRARAAQKLLHAPPAGPVVGGQRPMAQAIARLR